MHHLRAVNLTKRKAMLSVGIWSRSVRKTVTIFKSLWSINPKWLRWVEPKMMKIDTISKKVCSTFPIVLQRIFTPIGRTTAAAARLILSNDQHHRHPSCSQSHGQRGKVSSQARAGEGIVQLFHFLDSTFEYNIFKVAHN